MKFYTTILFLIILLPCILVGNNSYEKSKLRALNSAAAAPIIYYVDSAKVDNSGDGLSWTNAFRDIQAALDASVAGDQIWIKAGTYFPTQTHFSCSSPNQCGSSEFYNFVLKDSVAMYGGFDGSEINLSERDWETNQTILSGDYNQDDVVNGAGSTLQILNTSENARNLILSSNNSKETILDGIILQSAAPKNLGGPYYLINGNSFDSASGANLYVLGGATTIRNCTSRYSHSTYGADHLDQFGGNNSSTITNCVFEKTFSQQGIAILNNATVTMDRCIIRDNKRGQQGGAFRCYSYGVLTVTNSIIYNNHAERGGVGLSSSNSSITLNNCTIMKNKGTFVFGEELFDTFESTASAYLNNCIVYDNPSPIGAAILTNTLTTDPSFVDQSDYDGPDNIFGTIDDGCHIQSGSTAIAYGDNSLTPDYATHDIINHARIKNGTVDAGAFEFGDDVHYKVGTLEFILLADAITEANSSGNDIEVMKSHIIPSSLTINSGENFIIPSYIQLKID